MKYVNAREVLPEALLQEVQRYAAGTLLYVPADRQPRSWGEVSGGRDRLRRRNAVIRCMYQHGATMESLAALYFLSVDAIRKIIYGAQEPLPAFRTDIASARAYAAAGMIEAWARVWLQEAGCAAPPEDACFFGAAMIPLRLIRSAGGDRPAADEPLLLRYSGLQFHAPCQAALLAQLRQSRRNAHPAVILVPQEEWSAFMRCFGRHLRPCP